MSVEVMEASELLANWDAGGYIILGTPTEGEDDREAAAEVSGELLTPGTTQASYLSLSGVKEVDLSCFLTPEL